MISQLAINNDKLLLSSVSLLGQPLFEIRYHENGAPQLLPSDAPVRADWLLAMLQLATADPVVINAALDGAVVEENGMRRRLLSDEQVLMEIKALPGDMEIRIPGRQLVIRIKRLNAEPVQR